MIVRDEAARIARCLDSARALVDDMVVLDTGSLDATAAIARAHGARVFSFAWCDDFAAARNAALSHSDADWNLVLDADEWIDAATSRAVLEPVFDAAPCIGAAGRQHVRPAGTRRNRGAVDPAPVAARGALRRPHP